MKVAVIVPDEYMGDVIGDINSAAARFRARKPAAARSRLTPLCR